MRRMLLPAMMWTGMMFASCKQEVPFQYVLQVMVVDEKGSPTDRVRLSLRNNRTGRSDFSYESKYVGIYEFVGIFEMGSYQLWVHSYDDDYQDDCMDIVLNDDKWVKAQFRLEKFRDL